MSLSLPIYQPYDSGDAGPQYGKLKHEPTSECKTCGSSGWVDGKRKDTKRTCPDCHGVKVNETSNPVPADELSTNYEIHRFLKEGRQGMTLEEAERRIQALITGEIEKAYNAGYLRGMTKVTSLGEQL